MVGDGGAGGGRHTSLDEFVTTQKTLCNPETNPCVHSQLHTGYIQTWKKTIFCEL